MVHGLAAAMDLPLRVRNEMLTAAAHPPAFLHSALEDETLGSGVLAALDLLLGRHEPFPAFVMDGGYDIVRTNRSARRFLELICADPSLLGDTPNGYHVLLHPDLGRASVRDWPDVARLLLGLLQRKVLQQPGNRVLSDLLEGVLTLPEVGSCLRPPDFDTPATGVFTFTFECEGFTGAFLTTLTTFIAPNNITLEELSIESYYPLDDPTSRACHEMLGSDR